VSGFRIARAAERDLQDITDHIAHDDAAAARRVLDRLIHACRHLAAHPGMGHRRVDLTDEDFRFWPVHNFLIVYDPTLDPLVVVRILHGLRDVRRELEDA
jgi:plasmid stabilization system protein ParE